MAENLKLIAFLNDYLLHIAKAQQIVLENCDQAKKDLIRGFGHRQIFSGAGKFPEHQLEYSGLVLDGTLLFQGKKILFNYGNYEYLFPVGDSFKINYFAVNQMKYQEFVGKFHLEAQMKKLLEEGILETPAWAKESKGMESSDKIYLLKVPIELRSLVKKLNLI